MNAILSMRGVSKRFGANHALKGMQLTTYPGEIHALMGENGAGKSTLMKVLAGIYRPDEGEILIDNQPVSIQSPADARRYGISLIYQELSVAHNLTVAENVFMGAEPRKGWMVDQAKMQTQTQAILDTLGARFTANTPASKLSIAEQQQVEIARALTHDSRILIMDEPTAALSDRETEALFELMIKLKNQGLAIIYISHRMNEVYRLAQRVTVLRDGGFVGELTEVDPPKIVSMMVGRALGDFYKREGETPTPFGNVVLEVKNLGRTGSIEPANFQVRAGEIVGLAGLVGAGRTELARLIFGADPKTSGEVFLDGTKVDITSPKAAIKAGLAYVPEDRKGLGLFLAQSVLENTTLNVLSNKAKLGMLNGTDLLQRTRAAIESLSIKTEDPTSLISGLSGGNQQKVLLARWLEINPKVLILDEPTRGVDIGAKAEIYRIIHQLAAKGVAILCISSELPEIIGLSNRVLVMREGALAGEVQGEAISQASIMEIATGVVQKDAAHTLRSSPNTEDCTS